MKQKKKNRSKRLCSVFLFVLFFVCIGAAFSKNEQEIKKAVFYPPGPDEPRLQFLTSFSSSDDLKSSAGTLEKFAGAFKKFIVSDNEKTRPIVRPYGVAVYKNKIYVCDTGHNSIEMLDLESRKFENFRPKGEANLINPINLYFAENGDMYVADPGRGQVVIFDNNRNYLGSIGEKATSRPTDVLIRDDRIYICDLKSRSVKVYSSKNREYLFSMPKEGANDEAGLFFPTNLATDEDGNIYVSDSGRFRIQKYNPKGEFLASIGSHGDAPGQFARPKGVAVDKEGRIYVVDAAFENVQIFDKDGKLLLFFAEPDRSSASLVLPAGITIDYSLKDYFSSFADLRFEIEYLVFVTSQYGDRKLSVYGFGHKK